MRALTALLGWVMMQQVELQARCANVLNAPGGSIEERGAKAIQLAGMTAGLEEVAKRIRETLESDPEDEG